LNAESLSLVAPLRGKGPSWGQDDSLFERIACDLESKGYSICPGALPEPLASDLAAYACDLPQSLFHAAGVGRGHQFTQNHFVRSDAICWITGEQPVCQQWLHWSSALQQYLNKRLMLGLFSFESHFACYEPGDFYRRHYDAFQGRSNRVLSVVAYLNSGWTVDEGGELVLYRDEHDTDGIRVVPLIGTIVVFLSEIFPHEVLAANRQRWSIAGWFRRNTSTGAMVDPPR
jgi:SM-20-related protein